MWSSARCHSSWCSWTCRTTRSGACPTSVSSRVWNIWTFQTTSWNSSISSTNVGILWNWTCPSIWLAIPGAWTDWTCDSSTWTITRLQRLKTSSNRWLNWWFCSSTGTSLQTWSTYVNSRNCEYLTSATTRSVHSMRLRICKTCCSWVKSTCVTTPSRNGSSSSCRCSRDCLSSARWTGTSWVPKWRSRRRPSRD